MPDSDNVFDPRKLRELRNLTVTGTLSLRGSGKLETIAGYSAGGAVQAVVITAADEDRITFYSGVGAAETVAAFIQTFSLVGVPYLSIFSPTASGVYTSINLINTAVIVTGNTLIQGNLNPYVTDNAYDLGDATVSWRNLYAYNIYDEAGALRLDLSATKGTAYTPALTASVTSPTLGTGSAVSGYYWRVGNLIVGWAQVDFGTSGTNAGNGTYRVSLPVTASASLGALVSIGSGRIVDNDGADTYLVDAVIAATTYMTLRFDSQTTLGIVTHAVPFAWAASDMLTVHFSYEAA